MMDVALRAGSRLTDLVAAVFLCLVVVAARRRTVARMGDVGEVNGPRGSGRE